jgi:osmotically-inducible protein OsmY
MCSSSSLWASARGRAHWASDAASVAGADRLSQGEENASNVRESIKETASNVGDSLKQAFDGDKIKEEISRTGRVLREKTGKAADYVADATANARTTGAIKTKLLADTGLSALKINVDTSDGVVTLSGTVSSYEEIGKAMKLALETDGVQRVISTLQVKEKTE